MKIALCLSGYFGSLTDSTSKGDDGFQHIKRHILDGNDVDVFYHSWEPELKSKLDTMYHPKSSISEPQIDFEKIAYEHNVGKKDLDKFNKLGTWTLDSKTGTGYASPGRVLSHYYSVQKSIELKHEYEIEHNFKYDCVVKSRFDLGRINRNTSGNGGGNPYACQCINFDPTLDMSHLYMAYWDLFNEGPADMWFYSSSENMDVFLKLYEKTLTDYLCIGSEYHNAVTTGWPESKSNDFRSNELFKPKDEQAKNLHRYDSHLAVNGILLYKWFLMDNGLWENAKALLTEWE